MTLRRARLVLEDGSSYEGVGCGAEGVTSGEVVFNTSMTGYQEILTDPSYAGQIVTMTCPEMGNYGTSGLDVESRRPFVAGFIVRECSPLASNWRASSGLHDYLAAHGIVALAGIDTRELTRRLRSGGVLRGAIGTGDVTVEALVERARQTPPMEGADLVRTVTCDAAFEYGAAPGAPTPADAGVVTDREFVLASGGTMPRESGGPAPSEPRESKGRRPLVAAYDFGMKWNILRRLAAHGCAVRVFPAAAPAREVLACSPDGVFLSNGPGDPAALPYVVQNVRDLLDREFPLFGICLGHQLLALALGGRTFKLKFGHRGGNHPVKDLDTGRVAITSQNHGFAVEEGSLPSDVVVTHQSLYDGTNEGLRHRSRPVFSVQYHPEASPGPHDADYLFDRFVSSLGR
jgi:carbamoyl-phosphate synthase small subunit